MSEPTLLVVEDEPAIAQGLEFNFRRKGYRVEIVGDGQAALERLGLDGAGDSDEATAFDLVVLDVRLPEVSGFEVCQRLRAAGDRTPVLMLTARSQPDDIVFGLKCGADDYLVKPFDLAELQARVEALLRRRSWAQGGEDGDGTDATPRDRRERFGDGFWVDFGTWQAQGRQGPVELSRLEIGVMEVFLRRPGEVISRRELLDEVWQLPHHPNTRVVDNVIVSLRKAFEESSWRPRHIHNVRGVGYRFVP